MARSIASIALNQVDLSDAPAATNFADVDCNVGRRLNPAQYGIAAWAMASLRLGIIVLRSMTPRRQARTRRPSLGASRSHFQMIE
jgi:hypothetical protein